MRYFATNTTTPLTFSVCGQLISKDGFLHHKRCFDWDVLILITEGTLYLTANNTAYTLTPNQYIFLKAGEEHFGHQASSGKLSYLWVHVKSDTPFEEVTGSKTSHSYFFSESGTIAPSKRVPLLFHQLLDLSLEEQLYNTSMLNYSVSLLMMELSQEHLTLDNCQNIQIPPVIASVKEWVKANYHHPFTVSQLALEFGYQADYLSSLFKRITGLSLTQYTNTIRIETSKNLLANYDLSIKEAAYSCGFPDEKYYMKVFKKLEGLTPTQYKNAFHKKMIN